MYPVSQYYTDYLQRRDRLWVIKVEIDGVEYGSTEIVDFEIENSLALGEEFEIGSAILSKLTLTMRTTDTIPPNAKVVPYLALDMSDMTWADADYTWDEADWPWLGGVTEWLQLGEFYIDSRDQVNQVWVYVCYDKLVWADVPYISALTYPAAMQDVWDEICTSLGYTYDSTVVIDPSYTIPVGPGGYTKRQVLGYIAAANSASVYVGKDGALKFRRFAAADTPVYDMGASDYTKAIQTNPIKTYTRVVVTYDDEGAFYEAGTGDENHTLYLEIPFATQTIVDDLLTALNGFAYMPIQMDARGYPQIEAGDRLNFTRSESLTWAEADFTWDDADVPWDGNQTYQTIALHTVFGFNGGLKMAIEAPSKSDQQSEFQVDGTLTTAVARLNQSAVKLGKPYFGVTITKDEGIIVERSDHSSKAIFNSDELTFYNGTDKAIYFDAVDGVYKFNGTLEAADGVFSGSLSAATGTFAGDLSAAGGTFTGTLSAASGTFTGTVQAGNVIGSIISGGSIYGAYIATSASYPRTEMDAIGNYLAAMASETESIEIKANYLSTNRPQLSFINGAEEARFDHYAPGNLALYVDNFWVGGDLILSLGGQLIVDSFNDIRYSSTTLKEELDDTAAYLSYDSGTKMLSLLDRTGSTLSSVTLS